MSKKVFLTGAAGFIGAHTALALLKRGDIVIGVDNFNDYYDPKLKIARVKNLLPSFKKFKLYRADICDEKKMAEIFKKEKPTHVCHLAARAGVRSSLLDPKLYTKTNINGTQNLLELAREYKIKNFIFASTSSVYGNSKELPFSENNPVNTPMSPYAATKKSSELLCHAYSHLWNLPITCLRFFTVYGPWGRPDMALFLFTDAILKGKPIKVFNFGKMKRDFTYIDDIVAGVVAAIDRPQPYEIINIGGGHTEPLMKFITVIEDALGKKAKKKMMKIQPGDVPETSADVSKARRLLGYNPKTRIEVGIGEFVKWYRKFYKI